jgi:hypothetical protein
LGRQPPRRPRRRRPSVGQQGLQAPHPATDKRLARAQARKDRVTQILAADNGQVTAAQIAADLDITEPQAYRLLNEVRAAA